MMEISLNRGLQVRKQDQIGSEASCVGGAGRSTEQRLVGSPAATGWRRHSVHVQPCTAPKKRSSCGLTSSGRSSIGQ